MTLKRWTILCGILGSTFAACSSTPKGTGIGHGDVSQGGGGGGAQGGDTGACQFNCDVGGTVGQGGLGSGSGGIPAAAICGTTGIKAESLPVDMYVMFDQSSSMNDDIPNTATTWWSAAQGAFATFFSKAPSGISVGLQYFPLSGGLPACTSKSMEGDCCTTSVYEKPEVEVGVMPGNAAALGASIQNHQPTVWTPSLPALQGAINHMKAWAPTHLGHAPIVVLVTDGFPTECGPAGPDDANVGAADLAAIAKTAFTTEPKIRTFVVGFNLGQGNTNLDQIAKAGGTGKAFLIAGGNISDTFTKAMLSITSQPLDCSFNIPAPPAGMDLDPNLVAVNYTPNSTGVVQDVVKLNNLGDCDINSGQGWYYDSPSTPSKILICPGTCAEFAAGTLQIVNGCKPPEGNTH